MKAKLAPNSSPASDPRLRLTLLERLLDTAREEGLSSPILDDIEDAMDQDRELYAIQLGLQDSPRAIIRQANAAEQLNQSLTSLHTLLSLNARDFGEDHPRGEDAGMILGQLFPQGLLGLTTLPGSLRYAATGLLLDRASRVYGERCRELGLRPQLQLVEQHHAALGAALAQYDDRPEFDDWNREGERRLEKLQRRCLDAHPGPDPESRAIRQALAAALSREDNLDPRRPDF